LPSVFENAEDFEAWFQAPFQNTPDGKMELTHEEGLTVIMRLQKVLEPFMLRRIKAQVASELPDVLERTVPCELSEYQLLMRDCLREGHLPQPSCDDRSALRMASLSGRRKADINRKICNHPFLAYTEQNAKLPWDMFQDFTTDSFVRASGKFAVLDVVLFKLRKGGHKVLIFDPWTATLECLSKVRRRELCFSSSY
jgi:SNF2 family DNA or RNA helicase